MSDDERAKEQTEQPKEEAPEEAKDAEAERRKCLYVGNLPFSITEECLREVFGEYGEITEIRIPLNRNRGTPKGCAFINYTNAEDAEKAEAMNGKELDGRQLEVNIAKYEKGDRRPRDRDRDRDYRDRDRDRDRDRGRGRYRDDYRDDRGYRGYDDRYRDDRYRDRDRYRDDRRRDDYERYDRYPRRDSRYDGY